MGGKNVGEDSLARLNGIDAPVAPIGCLVLKGNEAARALIALDSFDHLK